MTEFAEVRARARILTTGRRYEQFRVGQVFDHHWGRTLTESDAVGYATLTESFTPMYFDRDDARAHGHADLVVPPMLVFLTVFGLSVEDLSENAGPFLGVDRLTYHRPVLVGETVRARSTVITTRLSASRASTGIITWHTEGRIGDEVVVDFQRTNIVRTADATGGVL